MISLVETVRVYAVDGTLKYNLVYDCSSTFSDCSKLFMWGVTVGLFVFGVRALLSRFGSGAAGGEL